MHPVATVLHISRATAIPSSDVQIVQDVQTVQSTGESQVHPACMIVDLVTGAVNLVTDLVVRGSSITVCI